MAVRPLLTVKSRVLLRFARLSFALLVALASPAQVTGVLSSAASNEPIVGGAVDLCGRPPGSSNQTVARCTSTHTDGKGRFEFPDPPAGIYHLRAEARGFLSDYASLDGDGTAEFTLRRADARFVPIWLMPEASISGRVFDENGRPMVGVAVVAIGEDFSLGVHRLCLYQRRAEQYESLTNKDGEFRVGNLKPGKYYLQATLNRLDLEPGSRKGSSKHERDYAENGYVPMYYPAADSLPSATPLCIGPGEHVHADFHLHPRSSYRIRGSLVKPGKSRFESGPLFGVYNEYGGLALLWGADYDNRTRTFAVTGLRPGSYELDVAAGLEGLQIRRKIVITDTDVDGLVLTVPPSFSLYADVHLPEGFRPTNSYSVLVSVHRDGESLEEAGWPVNTKGQTLLPIQATGHYRVFLFGKDPLYLKSAFLGDRDVLSSGFYLTEPTVAPLTLTLGLATGTIDGRVMRSQSEPANQVNVKLIARGVDAPFALMSAMTDEQGRFHFAAVPPGDYELVAVNQIVRNSDFGPLELANVKSWAKPVSVGTVGPANVELSLATIRYAVPVCTPAGH